MTTLNLFERFQQNRIPDSGSKLASMYLVLQFTVFITYKTKKMFPSDELIYIRQ